MSRFAATLVAMAVIAWTACTQAPSPGAGSPQNLGEVADADDGVPVRLRPSSGVRGIFEDSKGRIWFTSTDWVCVYDPAARDSPNGGFQYLSDRMPGVLQGGFQEDANGRLFMQNDKGIHVEAEGEFRLLENRDYSGTRPWDVQDGDLWFGADRGAELSEEEGRWGVYRVRGDDCTYFAFPEPPAGERSFFYALTSKAMYGQDGRVWFGTFDAAFGFDGVSWDIVGREKMGRADDPRHMGLRGYHLDSRGKLWMADNGAGVYVYDGETVAHFTALHGLREEDTDGASLHRSFSIAEDVGGNIWVGTAYSGIWRYEPSAADEIGEGRLTNFGREEGFPGENVWTIYRRSNGELLFASEKPGGVYRFNGDSFERAF